MAKTKDPEWNKTIWRVLGSITGDQQLFTAANASGAFTYYAVGGANGFSTLHVYPGAGYGIISEFDFYQKLLWLGENNNFHAFDPVRGVFYPSIPLEHMTLRASHIDALGLVWIGTDNGIYLASKKPKYFKSFLTDQVPPVSCRGFTEDRKGNIYAFTLSGEFTFPPIQDYAGEALKPILMFGIAIITDSDDQIWYSSESPECISYNPATGELKSYKFTIEKPAYFSAWSIHQLPSGLILMGSTKGLWIKDPHDENPPVRFDKLNGYEVLNESTIYNILEEKEGIWLSTDNGLFLVDMQKGVLEHIDEKSSHLPNNNILFLHKDAQSIYWLASRGGGLIRWDRAGNIFRSYTVNEGLSHNVIYAIYEDDFGFLWMPSDFGLMRFEKSTGICRTFLRPEGIPHEEFNRASYFK
ncbi:MAG TPA: two-component regulator propeller domain-containing protein, partial [Saprospiraceae bacterium]|nr:two-component regulator propeller domain-containing protein [Saprospiraceae bacterium]